MVNNLRSNCLLHHFNAILGQCNASEAGRSLHEHCVHLVACLRRHIVARHVLLRSKAIVRVLLDRLHVIKVNLVAEEDKEGHLTVLKRAFDEFKPVLQILKRLLVRDVIHQKHCIGFEDVRRDHFGENALPANVPHLHCNV